MATQMISCGKHGIVYRCDGSLSAPVVSVLNAASEELRDKLSHAEGPWCLKVLRTTERHATYLRDALPHVDTAGAMPSVLGCWDVAGGGARQALAIATEWVEGSSLLDLVARPYGETGGLAFAALFGLAKALAEIDGSLHRFAHGDVKPSNVIVPAVGKLADVATHGVAAAARPVRLVDFDTVSLAASPRTFTMPGTRDFSAPECKTCPPNAASDVYSLGACINYVLSNASGEHSVNSLAEPRPANSSAELHPGTSPAPAYAETSQAARPISSPVKARSSIPLDADCAGNAFDLAARCMRPDPARRPSAAQAAEEMRQMGWANNEFTALPQEINPPLFIGNQE